MIQSLKPINILFLILLAATVVFFPTPSVKAVSSLASINELNVDRIGSIDEMGIFLNRLNDECLKAKKSNSFTFEFQELVLNISGECINKIVNLKKQADLANNANDDASGDIVFGKFGTMFSKAGDILGLIATTNQKKIEEIQEETLDEVENIEAFLNSAQWQTPNRLITMSRYWMSWNQYYSSFLWQADDPARKKLLEKAIKGFSLTLIDIDNRVIVVRALFGRFLCFKWTRSYDKALLDLASIVEMLKLNDPLYIRCRYEQGLTSYRSGDFDAALDYLKKLDQKVDKKNLSKVLGDGLYKLRHKIISGRTERFLALLEKEENRRGDKVTRLCREALHSVNELLKYDQGHNEKLYKLTEEYADIFDDYSSDELGPAGNLGVADALFKIGKYERAVKRYEHLLDYSRSLAPKMPMIGKMLDDIYFRAGYSYCQIEQWSKALRCFDSLFDKFPNSDLIDKAVCLQYVAAAGNYKENPGKKGFSQYIKSIKTYLKKCPDPINKNEALFQLGKYYYDRGKIKAALKNYSAIEKDFPNYWFAQYHILESDMGKLKRLHQKRDGRSQAAKKLYRSIFLSLEKFQRIDQKQKKSSGVKKIAPHLTLLHARLLYTFGPEATRKNTLKILQDFESHFPHNRQLWLKAKNLKMKCYLKYNMIDESQKETADLFSEGTIDKGRWDFLNEWASKYYKEAEKLSEQTMAESADAHRETALMIYARLSDIALKPGTYHKYYDALQYRMAEIYMNENQTAKAKKIYQEYLKRNPESAEVIYNLGIVYEKESEWKSALEIWRKLSKETKAGTGNWFESRYRLAIANSRLGEKDNACKIIKMTLVLHPDLKDDRLMAKMNKMQNEICIKEQQ